VTDDFPQMVARAHAIATELDGLGRTRPGPVAAEATGVADFLRWLVDGGFVFLGYREYGLTTLGGASLLALRPGTGLGLLRREATTTRSWSPSSTRCRSRSSSPARRRRSAPISSRSSPPCAARTSS